MSRQQPIAGPEAYKTYTISAPLETHWKVATCTEVRCRREEFGWDTPILESDEFGQRQAHFIRAVAGRRFTEYRRQDGYTVFQFPPGQRCFATLVRGGRVVPGHAMRIERPELFIVQGGDWRGDPRGEGTLVHSSAESWVDDFGTHQNKLADLANRG